MKTSVLSVCCGCCGWRPLFKSSSPSTLVLPPRSPPFSVLRSSLFSPFLFPLFSTFLPHSSKPWCLCNCVCVCQHRQIGLYLGKQNINNQCGGKCFHALYLLRTRTDTHCCFPPALGGGAVQERSVSRSFVHLHRSLNKRLRNGTGSMPRELLPLRYSSCSVLSASSSLAPASFWLLLQPCFNWILLHSSARLHPLSVLAPPV